MSISESAWLTIECCWTWGFMELTNYRTDPSFNNTQTPTTAVNHPVPSARWSHCDWSVPYGSSFGGWIPSPWWKISQQPLFKTMASWRISSGGHGLQWLQLFRNGFCHDSMFPKNDKAGQCQCGIALATPASGHSFCGVFGTVKGGSQKLRVTEGWISFVLLLVRGS